MLVCGTLTFDTTIKKIVGHDDFDPQTGNKDIYAENVGGVPAYVRVQLTEDFEISGPGGGEKTALAGYEHIDINGGVGAHIHAPEGVGADVTSEDDEDFHNAYFSWEMGGEGKSFLSAEDTITYANSGLEGVQIADNVAKDDFGNGVAAEGAIINTAPACEVITMADYGAKTSAEKAAFIGWVIDTEANGGWAYWSRMLAPGEATGLLLTQVNTQYMSRSNYYDCTYEIHVAFEAVDETDKELWTTSTQTTDEDGNVVGNKEASEEAKELLGIAKEVYDATPKTNSLASKYFRELAVAAKAEGNTALAEQRLKQADEADAAYMADEVLAETPLADVFEIANPDVLSKLVEKGDRDGDGILTVDEAKTILQMDELDEGIIYEYFYGSILNPEGTEYLPNLEYLRFAIVGTFDATNISGLEYLTSVSFVPIEENQAIENLSSLTNVESLEIGGLGSANSNFGTLKIEDMPNLKHFLMGNDAALQLDLDNLPNLLEITLIDCSYYNGVLDITKIPSVELASLCAVSHNNKDGFILKRLESQKIFIDWVPHYTEEIYDDETGELIETIVH